MGKLPTGDGVFDEWMKSLKGNDGSSIRILGQYDTYQQLLDAHPAGNAQGDCYLIKGGNLYAFVGDAFAAELVCPELGLDVGQASAGGERYKQHAALVAEMDVIHLAVHVVLDRVHGRTVDLPPELHDVRVRVTPCCDQRLQLVFRQSHVESTHSLECTD